MATQALMPQLKCLSHHPEVPAPTSAFTRVLARYGGPRRMNGPPALAHRLRCRSKKATSPSHLRNLEHRRMEQLLDRHLATDQDLLVAILRERADLAHVLMNAVGPEVLAHDRHGVLRLRDEPGQRH